MSFTKFKAWAGFICGESVTNFMLAIFLIIFGLGFTLSGVILMVNDYSNWVNHVNNSPFYRVPMCPVDPNNAIEYSIVNLSTSICPQNTTNLFPNSVKLTIATINLTYTERYSFSIYRPLTPNTLIANFSVKNETGNTTLKASAFNFTTPVTKLGSSISYPWGNSYYGPQNGSVILLSSSKVELINSTYNRSCSIIGCNYTLPTSLSNEWFSPTGSGKYRIFIYEHGPVVFTFNNVTLEFEIPNEDASQPVYLYVQLQQYTWTNGFWFSFGALILVIGGIMIIMGPIWLVFLITIRKKNFTEDLQHLTENI